MGKIIKRNGTVVQYDRSRIVNAILKATTSVGKADPQLAGAMADKVESALCTAYGSDQHPPTVEDIQDVVEKVLMANGHVKIARNYIIYRHQRAMERAARLVKFEVTDNVPYRKIYDVLRWNVDHECESVDSLNRLVRRKQLPDLVEAVDRRYDEELALAARMIIERRETRIVIVAGPSSSGKTTATIKLSEKLGEHGIGFRAINIDHYFFDLCQHPRDEFGDYDYETPQALDLDLINRHLEALLDGKTIRTPHYDFKTGKRTLDVHEMKLAPNELLLIDSLHGLYDGMTKIVPAPLKFRLYIETLGQFRAEDGTFMRWADNRLLRRMVRDKSQRNLQPLQTLTHWHYVRRSELKHIIPYIKHADCIVNSALPYELPFLKARLYRYVTASKTRFWNDPKRLDAHIRANRVCRLLRPILPMADDSMIPKRSLLREFIGGSEYSY
jgi:uridine kinase